MKILLFYNDIPHDAGPSEADTLLQVAAVRSALETLGHSCSEVKLQTSLTEALCEIRAHNPDFVFNLVERFNGSDRFQYLGAALLELADVPFSGSSAGAIALTTDKLATKRILHAAGYATPRWFSSADDAKAFCPGRYIIKAVAEDASLGLDSSSVKDLRNVAEAQDAIASFEDRFSGDWFAEEYIEGREFNISVLETTAGLCVLPPAEIRFFNFAPEEPQIVGFRAKWDPESKEYQNTVRVIDSRADDKPLFEHLEKQALAVFKLFSLKGYARVDFRVDQNGTPWILEANANPCLAPESGFVASAKAGGIEYAELIAAIVCLGGCA